MEFKQKLLIYYPFTCMVNCDYFVRGKLSFPLCNISRGKASVWSGHASLHTGKRKKKCTRKISELRHIAYKVLHENKKSELSLNYYFQLNCRHQSRKGVTTTRGLRSTRIEILHYYDHYLVRSKKRLN